MDINGARIALKSLAREFRDAGPSLGERYIATFRIRNWIGRWHKRVEQAIKCLDGDTANDGEKT